MTDTTLREIKKHLPCKDGWEKLLASLGKTKCDDEPLTLTRILESNGLDDALWCLRALPTEMGGKIRLFNCLIAERALKFWEEKYPDDKRPHDAIAAARRFDATQEDLDAAWAAAGAAVAAARAAAEDAVTAWAAGAAARAAAWAAARDSVASARAAAVDAVTAAGDAGDAEEKAQEELFIQYWGKV